MALNSRTDELRQNAIEMLFAGDPHTPDLLYPKNGNDTFSEEVALGRFLHQGMMRCGDDTMFGLPEITGHYSRENATRVLQPPATWGAAFRYCYSLKELGVMGMDPNRAAVFELDVMKKATLATLELHNPISHVPSGLENRDYAARGKSWDEICREAGFRSYEDMKAMLSRSSGYVTPSKKQWLKDFGNSLVSPKKDAYRRRMQAQNDFAELHDELARSLRGGGVAGITSQDHPDEYKTILFPAMRRPYGLK